MPIVQDFQSGKQSSKVKNQKIKKLNSAKDVLQKTKPKARRRPYLEAMAEPVRGARMAKMKKHKESTMESQTEKNQSSTGSHAGESGSTHQSSSAKKIEISFPGSEILRAKMPKPFAVAEKVATEWVNDGNFED